MKDIEEKEFPWNQDNPKLKWPKFLPFLSEFLINFLNKVDMQKLG